MAAVDPVLAAETMQDLHVPVLIVIAVGAAIAVIVRAVRSRNRSTERDRSGEA